MVRKTKYWKIYRISFFELSKTGINPFRSENLKFETEFSFKSRYYARHSPVKLVESS
jgi:hypothetical protein